MGIFHYDGPIMTTISRITDLAILNILSVICSIPIITAGAAYSAKYYVSMKISRGEEPAIFKPFFRAFRENLKQGMGVSLISGSVIVGFAMNWNLIYHSAKGSVPFAVMILLALLTVYAAMWIYALPAVLARYQMRFLDLIKNSLMFTAAHILRLSISVTSFILPIYLFWKNYKWAWLVWLGIRCAMLYVDSAFFNGSFLKAEAEAEEMRKEMTGTQPARG